VNLDRFGADRERDWKQLEDLIGATKGRLERLDPSRVRRLGALYRSASADLGLARRRFPGDPVTQRLELLVTAARLLVYDTKPRRLSLLEFASRTYWRRVRERPVALLVAAALLLVPAALAAGWSLADPGAAAGLVPAEFRDATEPGPRGTDLGLSAAEEAAFSSQVLTNNIQVTFMAFAAGIAFGLGTALVLVFNGLILGAIGGLTVSAGHGDYFVELVAAHGVLELSCIVVAGAAGLRLGWAIVDPGRLARGEALVAEARRSVEIVLGTAPWLVLAGLIEGFVSRGGVAAGPVAIVGLAIGGLYWALVAWRGGPAAAVALTTARASSP